METQVPVMATGECAKEPKEKSGHNKEKEGKRKKGGGGGRKERKAN